nr:NUDIX domain-containing protein [Sphingomonas panacis]
MSAPNNAYMEIIQVPRVIRAYERVCLVPLGHLIYSRHSNAASTAGRMRMSDESGAADSAPGVAAATLILFSERPGVPARHLMIQRSATMRFAPNALVFPGGQVDADDHLIAADPGLVDAGAGDPIERAHRVAAIRETLEETCVAIAFRTVIDAGAMQSALKAATPFSRLLRDAKARLNMEALLLWAKWHPRLSHRRFDTQFYIARYDGDHAVCTDVDEVGAARWLSATEALGDAEAERAKVIFPTLCNLERLAAYPRFDAAAAHLATIPCRPISPRVHHDADGEPWVSIPDHCGYPVTSHLQSTLQAP